MNRWIEELSTLAAGGEPAVLVTVAGVRGSAPREPGARMIVTANETIGTIGGGRLEYECTRIACARLGGGATELRRFPLGAAMGQCCGGVVEMLFEPVVAGEPGWLADLAAAYRAREPAVLCTPLKAAAQPAVLTAAACGNLPDAVLAQARDLLGSSAGTLRSGAWLFQHVGASALNVALFGAGHVGAEVVRTLAAVDCQLRWIDSRRDVFPAVPANVRTIETPDPAAEVAALPAGSCYLVMTHSHALDLDICTRILARGDAVYCGLIGSKTKRRRFEKRFLAQGLDAAAIAKLVCPIGIDGIDNKEPAAIAIAAAAELLQAFGRQQAATGYPANVHSLHETR